MAGSTPFKTASQHTLRGYKFAHSKLAKAGSAATKKKASAAKKIASTKKAIAAKAPTKGDLEKRLAAMEKQIEKLVGSKGGKTAGVKASITAKAKELEGNLVSFIKEKKKGLDELQNHVSSEISTFLTSIKNKKD